MKLKEHNLSGYVVERIFEFFLISMYRYLYKPYTSIVQLHVVLFFVSTLIAWWVTMSEFVTMFP